MAWIGINKNLALIKAYVYIKNKNKNKIMNFQMNDFE